MKPPEVIYVGATDVDVKVQKQLDIPERCGEFDRPNSTVYLKRKQSQPGLRDTLLHELLHAIIFLSGVMVSFPLDEAKEEQLVATIAPWILALLRDNPKLVEFLLENREREY